MASLGIEEIDDEIVEPGIEPGASKEKMLITTDNFEDYYEQEINNKIDTKTVKNDNIISTIKDDFKTESSTSHSNISEKNTTLEDTDLVGNLKNKKQIYLYIFLNYNI